MSDPGAGKEEGRDKPGTCRHARKQESADKDQEWARVDPADLKQLEHQEE